MDLGPAGPSSQQTSPVVQPIEPALVNSPVVQPIGPALIDLSDLDPIPEDHNGETCSSSTTSDSSDGDDFFQLDPMDLGHPILSYPIEPGHSNIEISLSSKHATRSHLEDQYQNQIQLDGEFRPSQSPPLPTVVRNDVPDPNRIPSSVFARTKSTTPMEWSVASNESLFSIHVGNSSFSRDNVFLTGRSGELNFSGGAMDSYPMPPISPPLSPGPPLSPLPPPIPSPPVLPVSGGPTPPMDGEKEVGHRPETAAANAEVMKDMLKAATEGHGPDKERREPDGMLYSRSVSRQSDGCSVASFRSFAFPILSGAGISGSVKAEPVHQRMQSQQPELQTPKTADNTNTNTNTGKTSTVAAAAAKEKGWFSCISCCSFCR